jgi:hypothetical protein
MKLNTLKNDIYNENITMMQILDAEQIEIENIKADTLIAFFNNFVMTSDIVGIENYERILKIVADPNTESLDFRRIRIIGLLGTNPPYTKVFLQTFLNNVFGEGNWVLVVDHLIYTIYIDVITTIRGLYIATINHLQQIVPSNMILFITQLVPHEPLIAESPIGVSFSTTSRHFTTIPIERS